MRVEEFCSEKILWEGRSEPPPVIHNGIRSQSLAAAIFDALDFPLENLVHQKKPDENDHSIRYCITVKGIYKEQVVGVPRTTYKSHSEFRSVRIVRESNGTGTIVCEYTKPFSTYLITFRMEYLRDYKTAYEVLMRVRKIAQERAKEAKAPEYDGFVDLPEESVADLQAELFGADSELQGAFPDPTVNPLPELPDELP